MNIVRKDKTRPLDDRIIFTGTPDQCRICLTAMMSVAKDTEHLGDGFECSAPEGFRVQYVITNEKPRGRKVWER